MTTQRLGTHGSAIREFSMEPNQKYLSRYPLKIYRLHSFRTYIRVCGGADIPASETRAAASMSANIFRASL